MYSSPLFQKSRDFVERAGCYRWFILSALHGLVEPADILHPYDKTLKNASPSERREWAQRVATQIAAKIDKSNDLLVLAGNDYTEHLVPLLRRSGFRVEEPLSGLRIGERLAELENLKQRALHADSEAAPRNIEAFYSLINRLISDCGGGRLLCECTSKLNWPEQGVYFLLEPGELRTTPLQGPRVVRVGTHAIAGSSESRLWQRLSNHRGNKSGTGNHRSSVLRVHVGAALQSRYPDQFRVPTWGQRNVALTDDDKRRETTLEIAVSQYIGQMTVAWLEVPGAPGHDSQRAYIERNAIGALASWANQPPSPSWLGRYSPTEAVRNSGLWNVNHVNHSADPAFLDILSSYLDKGRG